MFIRQSSFSLKIGDSRKLFSGFSSTAEQISSDLFSIISSINV